MPLAQRWSWRSRTPDTFLILYGPDPAAVCRWIVDRRHPTVTMERLIDGLNTGDVVPARTWTWERIGLTSTVALLHNGVEVGEIEWQDRVRNKRIWSTAAVHGLNRVVSRHLPPPEPAPTRRPSHLPAPTPRNGLHLLPEYVPGDFDVTDPTWNGARTA